MATSALIILFLGLGRRDARHGLADPDPLADAVLDVPGAGATEAIVP